MFKSFSFISFFVKWFGGLRFKIIKIVLALLISIFCIITVANWNKIPYYEDSFAIEMYKDRSACQDSLFAGITIQRPYNTFNTLKQLTASWNVNFLGSYKRDSTLFVKQDSQTEKFFSLLADTIKNFKADSVAILFHVNGNIHVSNGSSTNTNTFVKTQNGDISTVCKYYTRVDSLRRGIASCNDISAFHHTSLTGMSSAPVFAFSKHSDISISPHSSIRLLLKNEDISQYHYSLKLSTNGYRNYINFLKIDFGGAARFTAIYPKPDREYVSGIIYTDAKKISEIMSTGLSMYCQLLEPCGLQIVRMLLLSMVAALFFGIAVKLFWESVWRVLKNKIMKVL